MMQGIVVIGAMRRFVMKRNKIIAIAVILILIFIGGVVMSSLLNPNNRTRYRILEENGRYFYRNRFSMRKVWIEFNDGLALIHQDRTSWGRVYEGLHIWKYVNTQGRVVLRPDVYFADGFSEGLAAVMPHEGGYWGYINTHGEMVIEPQFRRASMFENGVASVYIEDDGIWVLINKSGEHLQKIDEPINWRSQTQVIP